MKAPTARYVLCPMCGLEFEKTDTVCAHGCPLGSLCRLIRCPGCNYEFPDRSTAYAWLARLFRGRRSAPPQLPDDVVPLTELRAGERAELASLACTKRSRRNALAVFGLVPGSELTLQQRRPAFVVRVGETELALESDIAAEILVRRLAD